MLIRQSRKVLVVALVLLFLIGFGAAATSGVSNSMPVPQHTITSRQGSSLDPSGELRGNVLAWDLPDGEGESVRGIRRVSSGLLLVLADGVLVIDPGSGDELWRYRWPGVVDTPPWVDSSWEGDRVLLEAIMPPGEDGSGRNTVRTTLDADTGEVLHQVEDQKVLFGDSPRFESVEVAGEPPWEDEGVIAVPGLEEVLRVFGSSSGALLWDYGQSEFCYPDIQFGEEVVNDIVVTDQHVFALLRCRDDELQTSRQEGMVLHAFGVTSGRLLWTHAERNMEGIIGVSSDGSILYRYDALSDSYVALDTSDGEELSVGEWKEPRPVKDHWDSVKGVGVLLGEGFPVEGRTFTLTDPHGQLTSLEIELPEAAESTEERIDVGENFLHTLRWGTSGDVELTQYSWMDGSSEVVTDVLGRNLEADEYADVLAIPGGVVVYAGRGADLTSFVLVT